MPATISNCMCLSSPWPNSCLRAGGAYLYKESAHPLIPGDEGSFLIIFDAVTRPRVFFKPHFFLGT